MYDFHMHTNISFDSTASARDMAAAAVRAGLKEICFTDHMEHHFYPDGHHRLIDLEQYSRTYDTLAVEGLTIRRGVELGLTSWNREAAENFLRQRPFDFVIGSIHFADGYDPYDKEYWEGKTVKEAFSDYLEESLRCVRLHDQYDVLGHLTYVCKSPNNPSHEPVRYQDFQEIIDEILRELIKRGKGMEINTSGMDRTGEFLPSLPFLRRFRELGGEIVTIGSDAHAPDRVGQYAAEALAQLKEIFGYVCTFDGRTPIFHRL